MKTLKRLCGLLPDETAREIMARSEALSEIRIRALQPVQLCGGGRALVGGPIPAEKVRSVAAALMDHSVYAWESELRECFFTMPDGCRVGVCGAMRAVNGQPPVMGAIGSLCVRLCRESAGCSEELYGALGMNEGALPSVLILSPPGMGKTTLLRDMARALSTAGRCVAISDERHELAACAQGVPTLNVGCADVLDGLPKAVALPLLLRAMSPEAIVTDEIGGDGDALALSEIRRCGVAVIASAHAADLGDALRRPSLLRLLPCFNWAVVLGGSPGRVVSVCDLRNGEARDAIHTGAVHRRGLHAVRKGHRRRRAPQGPAAGGALTGSEAAAPAHDRHA